MGEKRVNFRITADDQASGVFSSLGGAIGNVATIAGGIVAAQVFDRIASGIGSFVSSGIAAVGAAQELESSLKALLTSNNMYAKTTEQLTIASSLSADEMAKNQQKAEDLRLTNQVLAGKIQEQKQRIIELTAAYGENGLNVQTARAELEKMLYTIGKNDAKMNDLLDSGTTYSTVTKSVTKKVMDQKEAFALAAKQTAELTDFISKLAVVSPFETQSVEQVSKYAIAAGLSVDETKNFAAGFLDLAAAVGIGSESLGFAADQLLQVSKVGKLTEIDLRQLRRMGIDVSKVLEVEMGMSVDEFNKKAEQSPEIFNELFNAVSRFSKNTFAGTSKAMATSIKGIGATLNDIFVIGGRELFRPLVDAVSPMMSEIVGKLSSLVLGGDMAEIGQKMADMIAGPLSKGRAIVNAFGRSFDEGFRMIGYFAAKAWPDIQAALGNLLSGIGNFLMGQWNSLVMPTLTGWADSIVAWIPQAIANLPTALNELLAGLNGFLSGQTPKMTEATSEWSSQFWAWTKTALSKVGEVMGALMTALVAWSMSPEANTQLTALGENLAAALSSALTIVMQNADQWSPVLTQIVAGLAIAAAAAAASLAVVGGTILAGMFSGISEQLTGYKPWTIAQFQQFAAWIGSIDWKAVGIGLLVKILEGINSYIATVNQEFNMAITGWSNLFKKTDWGKIGASIIQGIKKGIQNSVPQFLEYVKKIAWDTVAGVVSIWQTQSPSKVFAGLGGNLVEGLLKGVGQTAPQFLKSMQDLAGLTIGSFTSGDMIGQAADYAEKALDKLANFGKDKTNAILKFQKMALRGNLEMVAGGSAAQLKELLLKSANWEELGIVGDVGKAPGLAAAEFVKQIMRLREEFPKLIEAQNKANLEKTFSGLSQIGNTANQAFTDLQQRIAVVQTLLRQGVGQVEIAGQIMNAAQAQEYLNGLIAQQVGMQENLVKIQAGQKGVETLQGYMQALDMVKSVPANAATLIEQSARAMELLGQSVGPQLAGASGNNLSALLQLLAGGRGGGRSATNNITLIVNSNASESSVLQDFSLLQSLIPSGT